MGLLAAYSGPEIPLARFLRLVVPGPDALAGEGRRLATLSPGPYGFGWLGPTGLPCVYTHCSPPWCDPNLPALAESLQSPLWMIFLGEARSVATWNALDLQPHADAEMLFAADAGAGDERAAAVLRARLQALLVPEQAAALRGGTLSAYFFALLRQLLAEDSEMFAGDGLAALADLVAEQAAQEELPLSLNMLLADGQRLYALRHALGGGECEPLYFDADDDDFPDGILIASRPLTDQVWQAVPAHHLLVLDPQAPARLLAL